MAGRMSEEKLARLRKLAQLDPSGHLDPSVKSEGLMGRMTQPFAGIPSLLNAPLKDGLEGLEAALDGLEAALIGVPFDLGVTSRAGARLGPRAVRQYEFMGGYNHYNHAVPTEMIKVADVGDVHLDGHYSLEQGLEEIEAYYHRVVDAGVIPFSVGGDHSITYPILKAVGRDEPVGLVHIDAHCDTGPEWGGSKFHHGGPFLNAAVAGVLDPERTIQIGIRGSSEVMWRFSYESGMTVIHIEDVHERGIKSIIQQARDVVGDGPTYISFDVDGLDPAYAPGTGTPETGGLTPHEAQALIRGLSDLHIVGGDVVEVAPQYDPTSNTAMVADTMLFEILGIAAQSIVKRR